MCIDTGDNFSADYDISMDITVLATTKKFNNIYKNGNTGDNHNDEVIVSVKDRGTGIDPVWIASLHLTGRPQKYFLHKYLLLSYYEN